MTESEPHSVIFPSSAVPLMIAPGRVGLGLSSLQPEGIAFLMRHERPFAACRQHVGLNLEQAAARLKISGTYLRRLERGDLPLSIHLAQRMAVEYGISIRELTRTDRVGGTGKGKR